MTRTPDEIKKGLECCYGNEERRFCEMCPFGVKTDEIYPTFVCSDFDAVGEGALALIQQLEATVSEKEKVIDELSGKIGQLEADSKLLQDAVDQWELVAASPGAVEDMARAYGELLKKVEQLQAERDAAANDVEKRCNTCKNSPFNNSDIYRCPCVAQCHDHSKWEWRGAQKEDGNEKSP